MHVWELFIQIGVDRARSNLLHPSPLPSTEAHNKVLFTEDMPPEPYRSLFSQDSPVTGVLCVSLPQPRRVASPIKAVIRKTQQSNPNWTLSHLYGPGIVLTSRKAEENEKGSSAHFCGSKSLIRITDIVKHNRY